MGWFFNRNKPKSEERRSSLRKDEYSFRRSRTLTGTSSTKVSAAAEPRSHLKTDRLKKHDLWQLQLRVIRWLLLLGICAAIVVFAAINYIRTIDVQVSQPSASQPAINVYQKDIGQYFSSHLFERFGFLLNPTQLNQFLQSQHTEIASVGVDRAWYGGQVRFKIAFRRPLLMWQVANQRFYVDDKGVAFTYNHFTDAIITVSDQSGVVPDAHGAIASKRFVRFLGKLVFSVNGVGKGQVSDVIIPPSTREIDLKLAGRGYIIKTQIDRDPAQQGEDIKRALDYFDSHNITPQYVDVRLASKAFYK
jgi:hypothetical protein